MIQIYMQTWMCTIHYIPSFHYIPHPTMLVHLLLHQGQETKQSYNILTWDFREPDVLGPICFLLTVFYFSK